MYARWTGSNWSTVAIDGAASVGKYSSIAIDSEGYIHISYLGSLRYARFKP